MTDREAQMVALERTYQRMTPQERLTYFLSHHDYTVTNALQSHAAAMREEAARFDRAYQAVKDQPPPEPSREGNAINLRPHPLAWLHMSQACTEAAEESERAAQEWAFISDE